MRALFSAAFAFFIAGVTASAVQAAEPSMSFSYSMLQGVSQQECLQRGRTALTANRFRLAESTQSSQFGTLGDYLALVSCAPAQPTVFFLSIAGPQAEFSQFSAIAERIREAVTGQRRAPPPPAAGTK